MRRGQSKLAGFELQVRYLSDLRVAGLVISPTSYLLPPTSYILPPTSDLRHRRGEARRGIQYGQNEHNNNNNHNEPHSPPLRPWTDIPLCRGWMDVARCRFKRAFSRAPTELEPAKLTKLPLPLSLGDAFAHLFLRSLALTHFLTTLPSPTSPISHPPPPPPPTSLSPALPPNPPHHTAGHSVRVCVLASTIPSSLVCPAVCLFVGTPTSATAVALRLRHVDALTPALRAHTTTTRISVSAVAAGLRLLWTRQIGYGSALNSRIPSTGFRDCFTAPIHLRFTLSPRQQD
ncbi:uncharacterized protein SEPMUDRAFT_109617 [Sphaerulina musiva SO2202]|uniref:Uncharacterized protein n=1 Tax=Sphaerulina musiva (strain SO2202) TaxID=692275 RepID=M3D240_SPHMS|nr:uncharacterized protein SEPMUDRAFT_109617 [Sphaerulina musiva SO2202]EMF11563.1 hypothetical protein SEPMUDRAFT_109617 [Sphaerulina musiva SO2202]